LRPNGVELARFRWPISELDIAEPTVRDPPNLTAESSTVEPGDIGGTRKKINGDAGKPLTDARETSYVIRISLLTAECSTIELPGNRTTVLFSFVFILLHQANSRHDLSVGRRMLSSVDGQRTFSFSDG
jgi:hypothetical protein